MGFGEFRETKEELAIEKKKWQEEDDEKNEVRWYNELAHQIRRKLDKIRIELKKKIPIGYFSIEVEVADIGGQCSCLFKDNGTKLFGLSINGELLLPSDKELLKMKYQNGVWIDMYISKFHNIQNTSERKSTFFYGVIDSEYLLFIYTELNNFYKKIIQDNDI